MEETKQKRVKQPTTGSKKPRFFKKAEKEPIEEEKQEIAVEPVVEAKEEQPIVEVSEEKQEKTEKVEKTEKKEQPAKKNEIFTKNFITSNLSFIISVGVLLWTIVATLISLISVKVGSWFSLISLLLTFSLLVYHGFILIKGKDKLLSAQTIFVLITIIIAISIASTPLTLGITYTLSK